MWFGQRQPTVGRWGDTRKQRESTDSNVGITLCPWSLLVGRNVGYFLWTCQILDTNLVPVKKNESFLMQQRWSRDPFGGATNVDAGGRLATYWNTPVRKESAITLDILNWTIHAAKITHSRGPAVQHVSALPLAPLVSKTQRAATCSNHLVNSDWRYTLTSSSKAMLHCPQLEGSLIMIV